MLPNLICRFLGVFHPLLKSHDEYIEDARKRLEATRGEIVSGEEEHSRRQSGGRVYEALLPPRGQEIPRSEVINEGVIFFRTRIFWF